MSARPSTTGTTSRAATSRSTRCATALCGIPATWATSWPAATATPRTRTCSGATTSTSTPPTGAAEGNPLVHIVADASDPETSTAGKYTFYGRYVNWSAADNRRPLGTNFAARDLVGGSLSAVTSFIVWRDPKVDQDPFSCQAGSGGPSWYLLSQEGALFFDEQEHVSAPIQVPVSPQPPGGTFGPFPKATQRVQANTADLPVPYNFGWIDLDLNTAVTPAGAVPPSDPAAAQAWVFVKMVGSGLFSVGYDAIQLDNAAHAIHTVGSLP